MSSADVQQRPSKSPRMQTTLETWDDFAFTDSINGARWVDVEVLNLAKDYKNNAECGSILSALYTRASSPAIPNEELKAWTRKAIYRELSGVLTEAKGGHKNALRYCKLLLHIFPKDKYANRLKAGLIVQIERTRQQKLAMLNTVGDALITVAAALVVIFFKDKTVQAVTSVISVALVTIFTGIMSFWGLQKAVIDDDTLTNEKDGEELYPVYEDYYTTGSEFM
eukprot:TRINITY_DN103283_c0_g1_i1.p1 TRINITY_DN103283_c0_g1~~TRINITY_DN103283_c0_g1_i1.p1  ORF type:complete len:224 (+),score=41.61 TRINITY_DN103283_c0_g1_i1:16-687(+)